MHKRALAPHNLRTLTKEHYYDAGLDIAALEDTTIPARGRAMVSTGVTLAVPEGSVGLLWSRSGMSAKHGIECGAGCIDSTYRGEVKVVLYNHTDEDYQVKRGDRIAQLLTIPIDPDPYERVAELSETKRGTGGFGSTGA
jgi:dUTP pyrophosphatase